MPGFIPTLPTDASGAPELNRWNGTDVEPSLAERIVGHEPYPAAPPDYAIENYARNRQFLLNMLMSAVALVAQRASSTVTISGVTVGNQRRLTVNGTAVTYSDTGADTLATVTQKFVDLINDNATITAGANAAGAVYVSAGTLTVFASPLAGGSVLTVVAAVLSGAGTISASAVSSPDITIPAAIMAAATANCIVLGESANDAGPQNDVRLVLDRSSNALRAGGTNGTEWDTRALNSVGLGWRANPQTQDSVAIGTQAAASVGQRASAVGYQSAASAADAMAHGPSSAASGARSTALGYSSAASAADAISLGDSTASAVRAVAIGSAATASGDSAVAIGRRVTASGEGAQATGSQPDTLYGTVTSSGTGARAHAVTNVIANATLDRCLASGVGADAVGPGCEATGDYSLARGVGAVASNRGEQVEASYGFGDLPFPTEKGAYQAGKLTAQAYIPAAGTKRLLQDSQGATGSGATWTPMDERGYYARLYLVGTKKGSAASECWSIEGSAIANGGAVTLGTALAGSWSSVDSVGGGITAPTLALSASGATVILDITNNDAAAVLFCLEIQYTQSGIS